MQNTFIKSDSKIYYSINSKTVLEKYEKTFTKYNTFQEI